MLEGKTGVKEQFQTTKALMKDNPTIVHEILSRLANNLAEYAAFQIESGAQVLQVFDSWAGHIGDAQYDEFCLPYQQKVIDAIKKLHPTIPIIIYMAPGPFSTEGRRLDRLAQSGADIVSIDHTTPMKQACERLPKHLGIQGNLDPQVLRDGPLEKIRAETEKILGSVDSSRCHIMNLGHGILADTPEEHAALFVSTVQDYQRSS